MCPHDCLELSFHFNLKLQNNQFNTLNNSTKKLKTVEKKPTN